MLETVLHGFTAGVVGSVLVWIARMYGERSRDKARKAAIQLAADNAKAQLEIDVEKTRENLKLAARKDAIEEWRCIAGYHQDQCEKIRLQNVEQQKQLDRHKDAIEECHRQHSACEERFNEIEGRVGSLDKTVTTLKNGH